MTLQIAPRAPGTAGASVTSDTPGVELDPPDEGQSVAACPKEKSVEESSCHWGFPRGTVVKLTAAAENSPQYKFAGWSTPDCPNTGSCTLTLDDDYTSIAALFDPLMLGVRFSQGSGDLSDRRVTSVPEGIDCRPADDPNGENCTHPFPPNTSVQLTAAGANFTKWTGGASGDLCEPVTPTTCTIWVVDYTSWAGAIYDDEDPPQLATTIKVQFQVRKGGDGSGRVTAANLDCGSQCSAEYTYGRRVTLTAQRSEGSAFGGWNGVCSRTQTTCTFSAGPLTRIRALFTDAAPPSTPTGLKVTNATRSSVTIDWTASTDNVRVTGYRVYLEGASLADVTATGYTLAGASCGRSYGVSVDAVDGAENRSQKATLRAATKACSLLARMAGVRVVYASGSRTVVVRLQSNRTTTARLTLSRKGRARARGSYRVRPGSNLLRLPVRRSVRAGLYQLKIAVVDPDGGRTRVFTRRVRLRLAR
ncbi:MAG TPA: fibronectin type III domain-containing protein [Gaiellaceae bacterium]|nr:fibronectin type III domain-containing protein [Gaiellaceae bacterium]